MKTRLGHNDNVSQVLMDPEKMYISIWTLFVASSMKAALHMDPSYAKNLEVFKNSELNIESLFNTTSMMIGGNSEIKNVSSIDAASPLWEKSTLLIDQAMKWAKTRVYVYSDSVLCFGKMHDPEDVTKKWEDKCQLRRCTILSENCKEFMESRMTSSGKISQEPQQWTFSSKFREI